MQTLQLVSLRGRSASGGHAGGEKKQVCRFRDLSAGLLALVDGWLCMKHKHTSRHLAASLWFLSTSGFARPPPSTHGGHGSAAPNITLRRYFSFHCRPSRLRQPICWPGRRRLSSRKRLLSSLVLDLMLEPVVFLLVLTCREFHTLIPEVPKKGGHPLGLATNVASPAMGSVVVGLVDRVHPAGADGAVPSGCLWP